MALLNTRSQVDRKLIIIPLPLFIFVVSFFGTSGKTLAGDDGRQYISIPI